MKKKLLVLFTLGAFAFNTYAETSLDEYKASLASKSVYELNQMHLDNSTQFIASCIVGGAIPLGFNIVADTLPAASIVNKFVSHFVYDEFNLLDDTDFDEFLMTWFGSGSILFDGLKVGMFKAGGREVEDKLQYISFNYKATKASYIHNYGKDSKCQEVTRKHKLVSDELKKAALASLQNESREVKEIVAKKLIASRVNSSTVERN